MEGGRAFSINGHGAVQARERRKAAASLTCGSLTTFYSLYEQGYHLDFEDRAVSHTGKGTRDCLLNETIVLLALTEHPRIESSYHANRMRGTWRHMQNYNVVPTICVWYAMDSQRRRKGIALGLIWRT